MVVRITQTRLDAAAVVLIGDEEGSYEWSSTKPADEVAEWLHHVADEIGFGWSSCAPDQQITREAE